MTSMGSFLPVAFCTMGSFKLCQIFLIRVYMFLEDTHVKTHEDVVELWLYMSVKLFKCHDSSQATNLFITDGELSLRLLVGVGKSL